MTREQWTGLTYVWNEIAGRCDGFARHGDFLRMSEREKLFYASARGRIYVHPPGEQLVIQDKHDTRWVVRHKLTDLDSIKAYDNNLKDIEPVRMMIVKSVQVIHLFFKTPRCGIVELTGLHDFFVSMSDYFRFCDPEFFRRYGVLL